MQSLSGGLQKKFKLIRYVLLRYKKSLRLKRLSYKYLSWLMTKLENFSSLPLVMLHVVFATGTNESAIPFL
jgi:hypothetical protein